MTPFFQDLFHAGPAFSAAFFGAFVEFVEAATIVLAVGTVRGWRPALSGCAAGIAILIVLVVALGSALARAPIGLIRLVIGTLLLLFGMAWLRKAILRQAGYIPLHDEALAFARQARLLQLAPPALRRTDPVAFVTSLKAVLLEGLEVVFIVIAVGAGRGRLGLASAGAGVAALLVVLLAIGLRKPLAQVPENALKFIVGVLISAFGLFWLGEAFHIAWPGEDWSIPAIAVVLAAGSLLLARLVAAPSSAQGEGAP